MAVNYKFKDQYFLLKCIDFQGLQRKTDRLIDWVLFLSL